MKRAWPLVKLGDVLVHRKGFITIDDNQIYIRPRVQLHALGIVLRDRVSGTEIKTKKQQISKSGDFLVAEIDAKMGGFGIVPDQLGGAIVSSHYFLFEAKPERLLREYLGYYCKTKGFRNQVEAQGSTNYAAIRPSHVLDYVMPLPAIEEQQRIVTRIDTVQQQLQAADELRASIDKDIARLLAVRFQETLDQAELLPMREVAPLVRRNVQLEPNQQYKELGARSFGKGLFVKPDFDADAATWEKPVWIKAGDIVFSNIKAWEGAIGVAKPEHDGFIASHRYLTAVVKPELALPEYLLYYLLSETGLTAVNEASPGTADRNRTAKQSALEAIRVPVPTLAVQRQFVELKNTLEKSAAKRAEQSPISDAILPSLIQSLMVQ
jgi:type I restriction enzyme, S subunit